jgi:hypothetical protein
VRSRGGGQRRVVRRWKQHDLNEGTGGQRHPPTPRRRPLDRSIHSPPADGAAAVKVGEPPAPGEPTTSENGAEAPSFELGANSPADGAHAAGIRAPHSGTSSSLTSTSCAPAARYGLPSLSPSASVMGRSHRPCTPRLTSTARSALPNPPARSS